MSNRLKSICLLAALVVPVAAYALDEEPLSMVYDVPAQPKVFNPGQQPAPAPAASIHLQDCHFGLGSVEDARPSKQTAGGMVLMLEQFASAVPIAAASVRTGDAAAWLKQGLLSVAPLKEAHAGEPALDLALRSAQTWLGGMNIHAHVVLEASFPGTDGRVVRRYHGLVSKLNGAGMNSEFMTTLNMGLQDALQRLAVDLQRTCGGSPL